mgnify:CR=1 FL=1
MASRVAFNWPRLSEVVEPRRRPWELSRAGTRPWRGDDEHHRAVWMAPDQRDTTTHQRVAHRVKQAREVDGVADRVHISSPREASAKVPRTRCAPNVDAPPPPVARRSSITMTERHQDEERDHTAILDGGGVSTEARPAAAEAVGTSRGSPPPRSEDGAVSEAHGPPRVGQASGPSPQAPTQLSYSRQGAGCERDRAIRSHRRPFTRSRSREPRGAGCQRGHVAGAGPLGAQEGVSDGRERANRASTSIQLAPDIA